MLGRVESKVPMGTRLAVSFELMDVAQVAMHEVRVRPEA